MTVRRVASTIERALAAVGLSVVLVTCTPVTAWWAAALAGPWNDPRGETLIVLGGSMLDNGMIGESSYWRTVYARMAYENDGFRRVVISGGSERGPAVAKKMAEFLECRGVPADAIVVEQRSLNTRENALMVAQLLGGTPGVKVLMTSDYHMLRARHAFRKAGLDIVPRPFPDAIKRANTVSRRWGVFMELVRETAALGYYWHRGWV